MAVPSDNPFSSHWAASHLRSLQSIAAWKRAIAYKCTYLTPRTLSHFDSVIDAGCGSGALHWYLQRTGWHGRYLGCDWSQASLEMAARANPGGTYVRTDLRQLPFAGDTFGLVYARDSVIHAPEPLRVLSELWRVGSAMLLRLRIADVESTFTARYRDSATLHHWFNLSWLLDLLSQLQPQPGLIRYRLQNRTRRVVDATAFRDTPPFPDYAAAEILVADASNVRPVVVDDTRRRLLGTAWQQACESGDYLSPLASRAGP